VHRSTSERRAPAGGRATTREIEFARWAGWTLALTIGVVLFGAVVRITGSGAGCGQHWPTCLGEVAPLPRRIETAIELGHRLSSGIALLAVLALAFVAHRAFAPGHAVRRASLAAVALMVVEALIGAALVLFGLVDEDASIARALVMPLHLVTTSLLSAALALAAFFALPGAPRADARSSDAALVGRLLRVGVAGFLLVAGVGAVTALGDTLYPPSAAHAARLAADSSGSAHFLERLRLVHPISALLLGAFLFYAAAFAAARTATQASRRYATILRTLVVLELAAGVVNVLLSAPGWMQIVHLVLANLLWISLVLLLAECRAPRTGLAVST
jgi:heme A synthase